MGLRTYSDESLKRAVTESKSWRGLLRALGLSGTSSAAIRSVRHQCDRLGLDYSHFSGRRTWTDADLERAILTSQDWATVVTALGLVGGSSVTTVKAHAARLEVSTDHLTDDEQAGPDDSPQLTPDVVNLPRAGAAIAAGWLTLCGYEVSWPLEPSAYDLLALKRGQVARIQVKTTRVRAGDSWIVWLSRARAERVLYDPDEIDYFFVVAADMSAYLIPIRAVGGRHAIHLNAYRHYQMSPLAPVEEGQQAPGGGPRPQ